MHAGGRIDVAILINELDILAFGMRGQTVVPTSPEICCLSRCCLTDRVKVVAWIRVDDSRAAGTVGVGIVSAS